jgi:excisionase family DNA binding protein
MTEVQKMERSPLDTERLVWSVEEAGRLLGISRAHAYELVARGEIPHLRLGRRVVVPKHVIESLLASVHTGS